jgi:hypothetical protein
MTTNQFFRFQNLYMIGLPLCIFLLYFKLSLLPDLRFSVPEWIGLCAIITIFLALVLYFSRSFPKPWSAGFIITLSAIFRVMFLWRSPELSDDIYRYLFDGLMVLSGRNPYTAALADVAATDLPVTGLVQLVNHAELPTIYPPAAQFFFAAGAFFGGIVGMKLLVVILDLLTCILIIKLLGALKRPIASAVLYAWHPLPIIEIAASGHVDSVAIFFLFLSFVFLQTEKQNVIGDKSLRKKAALIFSRDKFNSIYGFFTGIFFAAAVLTKWVPLIFLPGVLMLATPGKRKYAAFGFIIGCTAMIGVFWPDVWNCFYTLSVYAANWEFSGFAFRWLRAATGSGTIARAVLVAGFIITIVIIYIRSINAARVFPALDSKIPLNPHLSKGDLMPHFFECGENHDIIHNEAMTGDKVMLGLKPPLSWWVRENLHKVIHFFTPTLTLPHQWGGEKYNFSFKYSHGVIFRVFYFISMAFLFFTPTLHPWYGLYLVVFLPFAAGPAGVAFSWSVFLSYRVVILYGLTGEWIENDFIPFLIVSAPTAAFAARFLIQTAKLNPSDKSPTETS